jgi:hypothetical protein
MAANGCIRQGSQGPFRIPARALPKYRFPKQLVDRRRHGLDLVLSTADTALSTSGVPPITCQGLNPQQLTSA